MKKRLLSFLFVLIFLLSAFPLSVFAAEEGALPDAITTTESIETSDVIDDLEKLGIDITRYRYVEGADYCRILHFLEWGYDYHGRVVDYGLYLYIYNPSAKAVDFTSTDSYVQLQAEAKGQGLGWKKHALTLCSVSKKEGYENVFYKVRVQMGSKALYMKQLERAARVYSISDLELRYNTNSTPSAFAINSRYTVTGYMPYRDQRESDTNSLRTTVADLYTINLELHPVTWKSTSSDKGAGYQYEVFGVYFSVPNDVIEDYGDKNDPTKGLVEVDGTYREYKTNMLITNNPETFDLIESSTGKAADGQPFVFVSNLYSERNRRFTYNGSVYLHPAAFDNYYSARKIPYICGTDYDLDANTNTESKYLDSILPGIWQEHGQIFLPDVDDGKTRGFQHYTVSVDDGDFADRIHSFESNHNALLSWYFGESDFYKASKEYEGIDPIRVVKASDVALSKDKATIAKELFIMEGDVKGLRDFVTKATLKNETVYLMRFAVRDYFYDDVEVYKNGKDGWTNGLFADLMKGENYYMEKTIFLDFDVISMTYRSEESYLNVLPVNATPIDILGTLDPPVTAPPKDDDKGFFGNLFDNDPNNTNNGGNNSGGLWKLILGGGILLAILIVLWYLGVPVGSILAAIGRGLLAVFRLIGALVKGIFDFIGGVFDFSKKSADGIKDRNTERRQDREARRKEREARRKEKEASREERQQKKQEKEEAKKQ